MLERFKLLLRLEEKEGAEKKLLKHVAMTTHGMELWAEKNNKEILESYRISFENIKKQIGELVKRNIPILTIYLLAENLKKEDNFSIYLDEMIVFLNNLKSSSLIHDNKVKVSALGKWYDIPSRAIEPIKSIIDDTKDYDSFFVNFCINYDGQEEIVDSCKLILRKVQSGKVDVNAITKEMIKENCYSSYFLPPNLLIKNGLRKRTSGLLLWDIRYAEIFFSGKLFTDFSVSDFAKALDQYKKD